MFVSKEQGRTLPEERREALGWLGRQLAWERVLTRLRVAAGVLPPELAHAATTDGGDAGRSAA
jgi:hypothetical protein